MARARLEVKPHDGRSMGTSAHRVIGRMLTDGHRRPSPSEVFEYVASDPILDEPHVYGQAARQRLITATAVYFDRFARREGWAFVRAEFPLQSRSLDLLWRSTSRKLVSDELKTGLQELSSGMDLEDQLAHQMREAVDHFGNRFGGIRVLFTSAPLLSFFVSPCGDRMPLEEGL